MFSHYYPPPLRNNEFKKGNVKVSGTGTVKVKPNEIIIQLGVITRDESAKNAQQENATLSTQLISALNGISLENNNIQTISYTVLPYYRQLENQQILAGFEVTHLLKVTLKDVTKVGVVLDTAFLSGANTAQSIVFQVSNESIYYLEALSLAVKDSMSKAQTIAQNIGVSVQMVPIKVTEIGGLFPLQGRQDAFIQQASTPLMVSDVVIEAKIEAIFSYL